MTERVRLGSIGLGRWGEHLADAVVRSHSGKIVRCYTPTESTRLRFAAKYGCRPSQSIDELLGDPQLDGVVVATPHSTHVDIICAAAAAGKHVFVEKPISLTVAAGQRAIDAASRAGVILQVANHRRRQSGIRRLKEWIDAGELGVVHLVEANFSTNISITPKQGWKEDLPERPLGGMTSLGLHILDDFIYLCGQPASVTALSKPLLGRGNLHDITVFALEFESGPLGYLGTGMVLPKMERLAVHGSEGSAWNDAIIAPGDAILRADRLSRQQIDELERWEVPNAPGDALAEQMREFAECIVTGRKPSSGGAEAVQLVRLLAAGVESQRSAATVRVADFDERLSGGASTVDEVRQ